MNAFLLEKDVPIVLMLLSSRQCNKCRALLSHRIAIGRRNALLDLAQQPSCSNFFQ